MLRNRIAAVFIGLGALLTASGAWAQTTGTITGRVVDKESGAPAGGVTVVAEGPQGEQASLTDDAGAYTITQLPVGTYVVRFFQGNVKIEQQNVQVSVDKVVKVNVRMPSKAVGEEVYTITEKAPAIDIGSTRTGATISKDFTDNVPTGRQFGDIISKAPGAFSDGIGASFNGATGAENNYILDGVNITSVGYGLLGSNLVNDFVQETEVITGGYNAEYGRALGGVVNVVTKSGTNEFHGSVFNFWAPYFLAGSPTRVYNRGTSISGVTRPDYSVDLGAEVGGPIVKNRAFFWAGYSPRFGKNHVVRITDALVDKTGPTGMPDGIQDTNSNGSPAVEELRRQRIGQDSTEHQYATKLSFVPVDNHSLSLGYYGSASKAEGAGRLNAEEKAMMVASESAKNDISGRWVSKLFDRKLQLEATGSYHREFGDSKSPFADVNERNLVQWITSPGLLDFEGGDPAIDTKCANRAADAAMGIPAFRPCPAQNYVTGGYGLLGATTADRAAGGLKGTVFFRGAGHHQLKVGGDFEQMRYNDDRYYSGKDGARAAIQMRTGFAQARGFYTLKKGETAGAFADGDGGRSVSHFWTPESKDPLGRYQDHLFAKTKTGGQAAFLQDSWSIMSNLTLNLGVRYEQQSIGDYLGSPAIEIKDMWAPRIGVMYDPTSQGRSKIYAHWGRFYESIPMDINNRSFGGEGINIARLRGTNMCKNDPTKGTPGSGGRSGWKSGDPAEGFRSCDFSTIAPGSILGFGGENALVQEGLKGQYSDEIILGGQMELFEDFTVGASFINRKLGRVIEDASGDGAATYLIANVGDIPKDLIAKAEADAKAKQKIVDDLKTAGMMPTALQERDAATARGVADTLIAVSEFEQPSRDYNALQVTASKRFSSAWMMQGSYTYSRTIGNFPGVFVEDIPQLDPNISQIYDIAELTANRQGPLPTDRPHLARIDGFYRLGIGDFGALTTGIGLFVRSGTPINIRGPNQYYTSPGSTFILPRGAGGRTDAVTQLDFHLGYRQKLSGQMGLEAFVDVFNILNQRAILARDQTYTFDFIGAMVGGSEADLKYLKTVDGDPVNVNPNWKQPTSYQAPIAGRLGLRLMF